MDAGAAEADSRSGRGEHHADLRPPVSSDAPEPKMSPGIASVQIVSFTALPLVRL
ncbi:hypothetical protein [Gaiella sp.]|uniref:hypothetical protein n=1 Tax=Gaiella sp. TaxID=2663207 RepID=UPI0032631630